MSSTARIATTVAASAAVLAGSYALYFDYQRRNNPEFRKQISTSFFEFSGSCIFFNEMADDQDYRRRKLKLRRKARRRH